MKILIVEDDCICRTVLEEFLTSYGLCHMASNGAEALIAVDGMLDRKDPYRLICLDLMMPGQDGPKLLKKIRELERQRRIRGKKKVVKIVLIAAPGTPKNSMKALVRGAGDGYLAKPLDLTKMQRLLARLGLQPLTASEPSPA